jgi:hypothetical protein
MGFSQRKLVTLLRRSNSQTSGAKPGRQYSWQASRAAVGWKGSSHLLSGNLFRELDDPTVILHQLAHDLDIAQHVCSELVEALGCSDRSRVGAVEGKRDRSNMN